MPGVRRSAIIATLALTALVSSGCEYLFYDTPFVPGGSLDPGGSFDPGGAFKPLATYKTGSASLTVDAGTPVALGELTPGPHLFEYLGADVAWTDGDGRYIRIAAVEPGAVDSFASITFDWIADGHHWTVWDTYNGCRVRLTSGPDAKGIAGTATCEGLRWADAMGGMAGGLEPRYVDGQAPFDAIVTFEAAS